MACTAIMRQYRHKAVARHWFGNGIQPPPVKGRLEFIQDTDASLTHSLVDLKGMEAGVANAFHVHQIPVQVGCTNNLGEQSDLMGHMDVKYSYLLEKLGWEQLGG